MKKQLYKVVVDVESIYVEVLARSAEEANELVQLQINMGKLRRLLLECEIWIADTETELIKDPIEE